MNYFTFLSLSRPAEIGYRVEADTPFDYRFRGCIRWAKMFQTYGDGHVQHSAETPFARELLPDFLGSLAMELANATEDHRREMLAIVSKHWPRNSCEKRRIRFALSLKCHETKTQYYDAQAMKVSTAASKKNDRRWEEIRTYDSHINGSIQSAAIVLKIGDSYDDLHAIQRFQEIEEVFREDNDGYSPFRLWEHFGIDKDSKQPGEVSNGWTDTAWEAVAAYVQSYRLAERGAEQARRFAEYGFERKPTTEKQSA